MVQDQFDLAVVELQEPDRAADEQEQLGLADEELQESGRAAEE